MGLIANMTASLKQWWDNYKRDVAIARKRQKVLRLIRDKSYAHEKGIQNAKTEGHRARQPPREYQNSSLFGSTRSGKSVDAIGTIEPKDAIGNVEDIFKRLEDEEDE